MSWYKDDKTGDWTATDTGGKTVQSGYVADSHGLAHITNGKWDGTYKDTSTPTTSSSSSSSKKSNSSSSKSAAKNVTTNASWYKGSDGTWTATDSSGNPIQNGYVADTKGIANVVNGKWDGTYIDDTQTNDTPEEESPGKKENTIEVYDPTADIQAMSAAQKKAGLAKLKAAYEQNVSDLNSARGKIEPTYYAQRNATSTDAQIAAKNFAEYMASRGQTNSGTDAQAEISNNVSLQGNLGNLARSEASDYVANDKSQTDLSTAYNNDKVSTEAGIDANTMQNLINSQAAYNAAKLAQYNADRTYNNDNYWKNVDATGYLSDGTQTLAGKQAETSITGQNIANETAALYYAYYPQILQGQIDGQTFENVYAKMRNDNYSQDEATERALKVAQIAATYASANASNASAAYKSSGGSSGSSAKAGATGTAMDYMNSMARGEVKDANGNYTRADRNDILNWIQKASGTLTKQGVNVNELTNWADNTFQWTR